MREKGREKIGENEGKSEKGKKNKKELGLVVSQQTLIRNQAKLSSLKKGGNSEKGKKRKRIRPRRVPTDGDSESGQNSAREQWGKIRKRKKTKKN